MRTERGYWLMKSEPDVFSIDDLKAAKTTCWDGIRNYQARNFMRDDMRVGDGVLFYHSNANPPGIAGLAEVVREAYPDSTAFDSSDVHYDPKSRRESPTWVMVDVRFVKTFRSIIPLDELRATRGLDRMMVLRRGSRLSVQPVSRKEWEIVLGLAARQG